MVVKIVGAVPRSGFTPSLCVNKGPCSLTVAKSLGPKVLCIAPYKGEGELVGVLNPPLETNVHKLKSKL